MRNNLHRSAEEIPSALFCDYRPVNFTRGNVAVNAQIFVDKSLVMTEVKVCFGAVVGNENLAVLIRTHCAGVNIYIRVEFLNCHL